VRGSARTTPPGRHTPYEQTGTIRVTRQHLTPPPRHPPVRQPARQAPPGTPSCRLSPGPTPSEFMPPIPRSEGSRFGSTATISMTRALTSSKPSRSRTRGRRRSRAARPSRDLPAGRPYQEHLQVDFPCRWATAR
jgi:hypothetical protein